jgi:hypothetical protein
MLNIYELFVPSECTNTDTQKYIKNINNINNYFRYDIKL